MSGCGKRCDCLPCRASTREAGFVDSGPFTDYANSRFDGMGPGVREAGAVLSEPSQMGGVLTLAALAALVWFATSKK